MQNSPALQLNPKHGLSANVVVVSATVDLVSIDVVWTSGGAVSDAEKEVVLLTDDAVVLDIDVAGLSDQSTTVTERLVVGLTGDSVSTDVGWISNEDVTADLVEKEVVFDIDDAVVAIVVVKLFIVDEVPVELTVEKATLVVVLLAIDEKEKISVEIFVLMDWSVVTGFDEADVEVEEFWLTVFKMGVVWESLFEDICS